MINVPRNRFTGIYERVIDLWPETVDIEIPVGSRLGESSFSNLVRIYYEVEAQILKSRGIDNDLPRILNWSIYQTCLEYAQPGSENGIGSIQIHNIPRNTIETRFAINLSDPTWMDLKGAVEQLAYRTSD